MVPSVGIPYVVEGAALIKGSKNIERAEEFLNWLGSAEFQAKWAARTGAVPAHSEALKTVPGEIQALMDRIHPQDMDWSLGAQMMGAWIEKIQLEFVQ
jgi:iron(III) transport system substrate-binding protein